MLLLALVSGCATSPPETKIEFVEIHDFCTKDTVLWFDHYSTLVYLEANEADFLRAYTLHNETNEKFC